MSVQQPRRRATSSDVARLAGVSRATVSYVLNGANSGIQISEATRVKVMDAVRTLDYRPSAAGRNLRSQRAGSLGLVIREPTDRLSVDPFLPLVVEGINRVLSPADMRLVVEHVGVGRPPRYLDLIREGHVDGLIISNAHNDDFDALAPYLSSTPVVVWGGAAAGFPSVDIDNEGGARLAVDHLLDLGHRRIACIMNAPEADTGAEAPERLAGYMRSLQARGIVPDDRLVRPARFTTQSGYAVARSLMRDCPDLTAIFAASDEVALGALLAVEAAGRSVPKDISIVGFDDIPSAAAAMPALTTVHVAGDMIGEVAARKCLGKQPLGRTRTLLDVELVVRASTGPVRSG